MTEPQGSGNAGARSQPRAERRTEMTVLHAIRSYGIQAYGKHYIDRSGNAHPLINLDVLAGLPVRSVCIDAVEKTATITLDIMSFEEG